MAKKNHPNTYKKQHQNQQTPHLVHKQQIKTGPIPQPEDLAAYNELSPGLAEKIVKMAKDEADHRHSIGMIAIEADTHVAKVNAWEKILGQFFGFIIGMSTIGAGVYLVINGHDWPGTLIGFGGVAALVSVFVLGRNKNK